jgi:hypothetical protein
VTLSAYAALVAGLTASTLLLVAPLLQEPSTRFAVCCGALMACLNTIAAYALARGSQGRDARSFVTMVLGGMLGRMLVLLALVVLLVLRLGVPAEALAASLLTYYVLFLALELRVLQTGRETRTETR